jgi:class 3 adenylate cyclase
MDVAAWLRGLGLGQYEGTFRESEIEADVLPELTDADLEKLGLPLGPRKRILKAIANLGEAQKTSGAESVARLPQDLAERRQLTVMFCDLVGSIALSARLDPEDMRQVIRAYQDACSGVVARYDGFVAKFMGDGILAYFGFPHAHEDDAERAVRAGLEIVGVVGALKTRATDKLQVRIGIATGLVVVGDLVGQGAAQEQAVVGDTPNLAARLQGIALPGQVVLAEPTRRLLGDVFDLTRLGGQNLKGIAGEPSAYGVIGVRIAESRFEARASGATSNMVGRDHELALMLERWKQAKAGRPIGAAVGRGRHRQVAPCARHDRGGLFRGAYPGEQSVFALSLGFAALSDHTTAGPRAGVPRRLTMYLATLDCATSKPSLSNSPWMRGAPQSGFSKLIRRINRRSSVSICGCPPRGRDFQRQ